MQSIPNTVGVCRDWGARYGNYRKHCSPRAGGTERGQCHQSLRAQRSLPWLLLRPLMGTHCGWCEGLWGGHHMAGAGISEEVKFSPKSQGAEQGQLQPVGHVSIHLFLYEW